MKKLYFFSVLLIVIQSCSTYDAVVKNPIPLKINKPDGHYEIQDINGHINEIYNVENGLLSGKYKRYYYNEHPVEEGYFIKGLENGKWISYWENGKVKQINIYKEGKLNGNVTSFRKNGSLKGKTLFQDGLRMGFDSLFISNKLASVYEHKDGRYTKRYGSYVYYRNDTLKKIVFHKVRHFGRWTGDYIFYYKNGKIKIKGQYERTHKDGSWKYYDFQGNLIKIEKYNMGKLIKD